jgi:hypothetical protein
VILRSTAVLVFAVGALGLFAGVALLGRAPGLSPETQHLRAMKDREDAPTTVRDVDMEWFARLPHRAPMPERTRIEQQGVRMEGSVQRIELSGDGSPRTATPRTSWARSRSCGGAVRALGPTTRCSPCSVPITGVASRGRAARGGCD